MNEEAQKLFTYMSISGVGHDVYAMKFLPLRIQDNDIVRVYLKEYGKALRSGHLSQDERIRRGQINKLYGKLDVRKEELLKGEEDKAIEAEKVRTEAGKAGGYKFWLKQVYDKYDPQDEENKLCG
jgi:hypothetical protein